MKRHFFSLCLTIWFLFDLGSSCYAQSSGQYYDWLVRSKTGSFTYTAGVIEDTLGNYYWLVNFDGHITFGTTFIASFFHDPLNPGSHDVLLIKVNPSGQISWINHLGGKYSDWARGVYFNSAGKVVVDLQVTDTADLDPSSNVVQVLAGIYSPTYEPSNGNYVGLNTATSQPAFSRAYRREDAAGRRVYANWFLGTIDLDPGTGTVSRTLPKFKRGIYVSHLNSNGIYDWGFVLPEDSTFKGSLEIDNHDLDAQGNLYLSGRFDDSLDFDPGVGRHWLYASRFTSFVAKYSAIGQLIWVRTTGGDNLAVNFTFKEDDLIVDQNNNIWTIDEVRDSANISLNGGVHQLYSDSTYADAYFAKYDTSGQLLTVEEIESQKGITYDYIQLEKIHHSANGLVVSGQFRGEYDFDPGPGTAVESSLSTGLYFNDLVLARYQDCPPDTPHVDSVTLNCNKLFTFPDGDTTTQSMTDTSYLQTSLGCDSTIVTILQQPVRPWTTVTAAVCTGKYFVFPDGDSSNVAQVDTSFYSNSQGCRSVVITQLSVSPRISVNRSDSICRGAVYTFPNGDTSSVPQVHTSFLQQAGHCDSIIMVSLKWANSYSLQETKHVCQGDVFTFPDGSTSSNAGKHTSFLSTAFGCDSVIETTLIVDSVYFSYRFDSICDGTTYTFPDGTTTQSTQLNTSVLASVQGCDSTIRTQVTVLTVDTSVVQNGSRFTAQGQGLYQWLDCDNNQVISGENTRNYTTIRNGRFALIMEQNGCVDTSACYAVTGLFSEQQVPLSSFRIFPNPSSGQLTIDRGESVHAFSFKITDLQGRVLMEQVEIESSQKILDLSSYETGIYLLMLEQNGQSVNHRIILRSE